MKKIIFGIFAHPDDESFGPSGTILTETNAGNEVHLFTLTAGDAGNNPDKYEDLASERLKEWYAAGTLMGVSSQTFLGYKDGALNNESMIEIGETLLQLVDEILAKNTADIKIEFLSSDLNGISGHIDHIVAARAACYAFYTRKKHDTRVIRIRLACIDSTILPAPSTDWLFMEAGRKSEEIDETIDARDLQPQIIKIMKAHRTQRGDYVMHLKRGREFIGLDHFIVKT